MIRLLPHTIEDLLELEGVELTGWTSDPQEAFMAPYEGDDSDLTGLAECVDKAGNKEAK